MTDVRDVRDPDEDAIRRALAADADAVAGGGVPPTRRSSPG